MLSWFAVINHTQKCERILNKIILNLEENGYYENSNDMFLYTKRFHVENVTFKVDLRVGVGNSYRGYVNIYANEEYCVNFSYHENDIKNIASDIDNHIVYFWISVILRRIYAIDILYLVKIGGDNNTIRRVTFGPGRSVEIDDLTKMTKKEALSYMLSIVGKTIK